MILGAINIGTNSTKALFAKVQASTWKELSRSLEITGLGEGLCEGHLSPQAIARTEEAVVKLTQEGRALGAERIWIAGTEALRKATDSHRFQKRLAKRGLNLEILSGQREAALSFTGMTKGLTLSGSGLAFDLGAGSLEIMLGEGNKLKNAVSLPLGAGFLTEEFLKSDPPTIRELQTMEEHLCSAFDTIPFRAGHWLVGLGGGVTALCQLAMGQREYSRNLHGQRLTLIKIKELYAQLSGLSTLERTALPGFENTKRARIAPAGAVVLIKLLEATGAQELVVSEAGILDGMMAFMTLDFLGKFK
jgi:exopolyphosphatase/guanosine-5'-triphosphate,3'-diphosphate pyrophosphatase